MKTLQQAQRDWLDQSLRTSRMDATRPIHERGYRADRTMAPRDTDETANERNTRQARDYRTPRYVIRSNRDRLARGTSVLWGEQVGTFWPTVPSRLLALRGEDGARVSLHHWNVIPDDWKNAIPYPAGKQFTPGERAAMGAAGIVIGANVRYASPAWDYLSDTPAEAPTPRHWQDRSVIPTYMVRSAAERSTVTRERLRGSVPSFTVNETRVGMFDDWAECELCSGSGVALVDEPTDPAACKRCEGRGVVPVKVPRLVATVGSDAVMGASRDPGAPHAWALQLESAGTAMLHNAGSEAFIGDVFSKRHRRYQSRPDRVAFKGTARFTLSVPCRYGAVRGVPREEVRADGTVELFTLFGPAPSRRAERREGWRGHRRVVVNIPERRSPREQAERDAAKVARENVGATGKRGKAVSAWAMSERSLARAVITRGVVEQVATLEGVLRIAAEGDRVMFGPVAVDVIGPSDVRTSAGITYGMREYARRAALAGVTLMGRATN